MTPTLPTPCTHTPCTDDADPSSPDGFCGPHDEANDIEWDRVMARIARRK